MTDFPTAPTVALEPKHGAICSVCGARCLEYRREGGVATCHPCVAATLRAQLGEADVRIAGVEAERDEHRSRATLLRSHIERAHAALDKWNDRSGAVGLAERAALIVADVAWMQAESSRLRGAVEAGMKAVEALFSHECFIDEDAKEARFTVPTGVARDIQKAYASMYSAARLPLPALAPPVREGEEPPAYLGDRAVTPGRSVPLTCEPCNVWWTGCAAEACCPRCGDDKSVSTPSPFDPRASGPCSECDACTPEKESQP